VERIRLAEDLTFSRIIHGLWRLAEWNYSKEQILDLIEILQSSMGHEVP
jgi:predicted oxidoreductase